MAIVTRYFSTASAGAGDGTTWADRAELFPSGNWSTVITGFDFSGSDSLVAVVGPGTYTCGQSLASGLFGNAPSAANPLLIHGGDSSGNMLSPPDGDWTSDRPAWDGSSLPDIQTSTNIGTVNLANLFVVLIKFTATGATTNSVLGGSTPFYDWVIASNSASNASATVSGTTAYISNSVLTATGSAYAAVCGGAVVINCRLEGNASASSGNRHGWASATALPILQRVTSINNPGSGVISTSVSTAFAMTLTRSLILGSGGTGLTLPSTGSQTAYSRLSGNYIANNGAYGIDAQSGARVVAINNRLRDNTSGNFNGFLNYTTTETNYTVDASDSDEFVDAGVGDYQIKSSATIAGRGFAVSEQCPAGSGGAKSFVFGVG